LNNKIAALQGVVESADAKPTEQAYSVFRTLTGSLDEQLSKLDAAVKSRLPAVNQQLQRQKLDAIKAEPLKVDGQERREGQEGRERGANSSYGVWLSLPALSCPSSPLMRVGATVSDQRPRAGRRVSVLCRTRRPPRGRATAGCATWPTVEWKRRRKASRGDGSIRREPSPRSQRARASSTSKVEDTVPEGRFAGFKHSMTAETLRSLWTT
jgi:hypothetical protein